MGVLFCKKCERSFFLLRKNDEDGRFLVHEKMMMVNFLFTKKMMMVVFLFHVKQKMKGKIQPALPLPDCHFQAEFCTFHIRPENGFGDSLCVVIAVCVFCCVL